MSNRRPKTPEERREDMAATLATCEEFIKRLKKAQRLHDWQIVNGCQSSASMKRQSHEVTSSLLNLRRTYVRLDPDPDPAA